MLLPALRSAFDTTIAIVDGYSTGRLLGARLVAAGVRCIHVRSRPDVDDYFKLGFDPSLYAADYLYEGDLTPIAERLRCARVAQVVAGTESGVVIADRLNDLLSLPGNAVDLTAARRDKSLMAEVVGRAGLATPKGQRCLSVEEAVGWFAEQQLAEAVVKPLDSAGTDNVKFCADIAGVRAAAEAILGSNNLFGYANTGLLVQERLHGTEYYANTVSVDGVHKLAELWRYTKRDGRTGAPTYDFEEPVAVGSPEGQRLASFTREVLTALGVQTGAAHTEVIVTERGPVHIETGARMGGATAPDVIERYCGVSQTALFASSLLDPATVLAFDDQTVCWRGHVRNVSLVNHVAGIAREPEWVHTLGALPTAVRVASFSVPGVELAETVDLIDSPGFVYLAADSAAEIERDYQALRELERARNIYTLASHA